MTKAEEINTFMLNEFFIHDVEDTTENRLAFLIGLREVWKEDDSESSWEKTAYKIALNGEIMLLKMKLRTRV